MTTPLSWKVGGAAIAVIAVALTWHGLSLYLQARHADELARELAHSAELEANAARAQTQQRSAELAATLERRRKELANTYRQVNEDAAHYQHELELREEKHRQEQLRIKASYRLGPDQRCAAGLVINRRGSSFTQAIGRNGQPIRCVGDTAAEPLR